MKKFDSILSKIYLILGVFVIICFASYFLKLIISPEGTLPWIATTSVMAGVTVPFLLRRQLRRLLGKLYVPLKAIMCAGMIFYTVTFLILVGYIYLSPAASPVSDTGTERVYIIFGAKVKPEGPTKTLASRLRCAADTMKEDTDSVCIVSGGQGSDEPTTEAECMRDYMVSLGIAPSRIYLETEASNTRENIEYSVALIKELGLGEREIVCISSDTHIPRIRLMCKRANVDAQFIKADTPQKQFLFTTWVREYLSYVKMIVIGG